MVKFVPNDTFMAELESELDGAMREAGTAAAVFLNENLQEGPRSGVHWGGMPNRSSSKKEYPQEQSGSLIDSIDVQSSAPMSVDVGFFDEDMDKLEELEFWGSDGFGKGVRRPLWKQFEGRDAAENAALMSDAIERNG